MGLLALGALSGFGTAVKDSAAQLQKTVSEDYLMKEREKYLTLRDDRQEGYKIAAEGRAITNIGPTEEAKAEAGVATAPKQVQRAGILSTGALQMEKENLSLKGDIALGEGEIKQNVEASLAPRQRILEYNKRVAELDSQLKTADQNQQIALNAAKTETLAKIQQAKALDADPTYKTAMNRLADVGQTQLQKLQIKEAAYKVAHQDEDHSEAIKTKKIAELAIIYKGSRDEVDRLELAKVKLETFKDPLGDPDKQKGLLGQIQVLDEKIAREQSWVDAVRGQIGGLTGTKAATPASKDLKPVTGEQAAEALKRNPNATDEEFTQAFAAHGIKWNPAFRTGGAKPPSGVLNSGPQSSYTPADQAEVDAAYQRLQRGRAGTLP